MSNREIYWWVYSSRKSARSNSSVFLYWSEYSIFSVYFFSKNVWKKETLIIFFLIFWVFMTEILRLFKLILTVRRRSNIAKYSKILLRRPFRVRKLLTRLLKSSCFPFSGKTKFELVEKLHQLLSLKPVITRKTARFYLQFFHGKQFRPRRRWGATVVESWNLNFEAINSPKSWSPTVKIALIGKWPSEKNVQQ